MPRVHLKVVKTPDENAALPDRRAIFDVLGVPNEGASPRGSTYHKLLMGCPREFALEKIAGIVPESISEPLTVGWLYHHCLQLFYQAVMEHQKTHTHRPSDPEWLWGGEKLGMQQAYATLDKLQQEPGYAETGDTVRRLLDGYFETYSRQDRWRIIAVEVTLFYEGGPGELQYSARLDLLVEDYDRGGMWIIEHKSARAITADLLETYQLDLQVLGQVWLMRETVDLSKYPQLRGVKVNIGTKAKTPKYVRVEVAPSQGHLDNFERAVGRIQALKSVFEALDWPQFLGHCAGFYRGYTHCQYYNLCHGHPNVSVDRWKSEEPPYGYKRVS